MVALGRPHLRVSKACCCQLRRAFNLRSLPLRIVDGNFNESKRMASQSSWMGEAHSLVIATQRHHEPTAQHQHLDLTHTELGAVVQQKRNPTTHIREWQIPHEIGSASMLASNPSS